MQRRIYNILALAIIIAFTACDNYLINGQLDGIWQLQTIERNNPDTIIRNKGDLFYSFQRHTILIGDYNEPNDIIGQLKNEQYDCLFERIGDSIMMEEFQRYYIENNDTPSLTTLKRFGLYEKKNAFNIEEITIKRLVLRSDSALLTMRRY